MNFNKVVILMGKGKQFITLNKTTNINKLIKTYNLQATYIKSETLIKNLKAIFRERIKIVRDNAWKKALKSMGEEWKLLSHYCNIDFKCFNYKTSAFVNDTRVYLLLKIKY